MAIYGALYMELYDVRYVSKGAHHHACNMHSKYNVIVQFMEHARLGFSPFVGHGGTVLSIHSYR